MKPEIPEIVFFKDGSRYIAVLISASAFDYFYSNSPKDFLITTDSVTRINVKGETMRSYFKVLALIGLGIFASSYCHAATITGTVKGVDGAPFQGAFVEAQNTKTKMNFIVLSDSQGQYRIENVLPGDYRLQI